MIERNSIRDVFDDLYKVIKNRKEARPPNSYIAQLFNEGRGKICKKFGEEAVETIIAALSEKKQNVIYESSDTLVHLFVLWAEMEIEPREVLKELQKRFGISGIKEKQNRDERN